MREFETRERRIRFVWPSWREQEWRLGPVRCLGGLRQGVALRQVGLRVQTHKVREAPGGYDGIIRQGWTVVESCFPCKGSPLTLPTLQGQVQGRLLETWSRNQGIIVCF